MRIMLLHEHPLFFRILIQPEIRSSTICPMRSTFLVLKRSLEWTLGLRSDAGQVAPLAIVPVEQSGVSGDAVLSV